MQYFHSSCEFQRLFKQKVRPRICSFLLDELMLFITVHRLLQTYQLLEALPAFHLSFVISVHLENDCLASCSHETQAVSQKSVPKILLQSSYSLSCLRELLFYIPKNCSSGRSGGQAYD